MTNKLLEIFEGKKILILGFGKEGQSTYRLIRQFIPDSQITIADKNKEVFFVGEVQNKPVCELISGDEYLEGLGKYDMIIKAPGIPRHLISSDIASKIITSQTELFLKLFSKQVIGVSGTKGKSTTSSLIFHILSTYFNDVVFVGNIGIPPFEMLDRIQEETKIVFEMSAHQLENISVSPHYAVLLNIFQEHLDHFGNYEAYQNAKFNIFRFQNAGDYLIYNTENPIVFDKIRSSKLIQNQIPLSFGQQEGNGVFGNEEGEVHLNLYAGNHIFNFNERKQLPGKHNLMNIMAAVAVCRNLRIPLEIIFRAVVDFKGLSHRLEYIGKYKDIYFYNDSIATIPEAVIEAVKTLKNVDTLIIGGKDRGIDYSGLVYFLNKGIVRNVIFIGEAGKRILKEINDEKKNPELNCYSIKQFQEMGSIIREYTKPGKICLLSPAASSYDMFLSFEERGEAFKKIAKNL